MKTRKPRKPRTRQCRGGCRRFAHSDSGPMSFCWTCWVVREACLEAGARSLCELLKLGA